MLPKASLCAFMTPLPKIFRLWVALLTPLLVFIIAYCKVYKRFIPSCNNLCLYKESYIFAPNKLQGQADAPP